MESIDETATESTHDETLAKIHHQLVLHVKEKEQIDELRYTQAKLAEATESLGKHLQNASHFDLSKCSTYQFESICR